MQNFFIKWKAVASENLKTENQVSFKQRTSVKTTNWAQYIKEIT